MLALAGLAVIRAAEQHNGDPEPTTANLSSAALPDPSWEFVGELGGSKRSTVRRMRVGGQPVIVKEFHDEGDGWARESAALAVLPSAVPAPRLIATQAQPPVVVMTDAGTGGSVADALLGSSRSAAEEAVVSWARSIGGLHRETAGLRGSFRTALGDGVPESLMPSALSDAADVIEHHCASLGVPLHPDALPSLRSLAGRLGEDGPAALTPADACPDNNVLTDDGLVLIDFEGAQWRHVAWDVAYLQVPWPSCWCSWRIPAALSDRALDVWREASASPYAWSPDLESDLAAARAGWAMISVSWFLPLVMTDDPLLSKPGPTRRALCLDRLAQVRSAADLPALAALAGELHGALVERWGPIPLPYAPAFRT